MFHLDPRERGRDGEGVGMRDTAEIETLKDPHTRTNECTHKRMAREIKVVDEAVDEADEVEEARGNLQQGRWRRGP